MPTYEYECTACKTRFERVQRFTDPALTECPECSGAVRRVLFPAGVVFKGSGWYITDSRPSTSSESSSTSDASASANSESGSSSGSDTKSDSGANAKKEAKGDSGSGAKKESKGDSGSGAKSEAKSTPVTAKV